MASGEPVPFDPDKPFAEICGIPQPPYAYGQNGWYYDGFYRPVMAIPVAPPMPPEYLAVLKRRQQKKRVQPQHVLNLGAEDEEVTEAVRIIRRENRRVRAAEELAE